MNLDKFTERARGFVLAAQSEALGANHQRLTAEHLLKALLEDDQRLAANLITASGGNPDGALTAVNASIASMPKVTGGEGQIYMDPAMARVLDEAQKIATKSGDAFVTAERLLMALAMAKGSEAATILESAGVRPQTLNAAIDDLRKGRTADTASAEEGYDALNRFARDLTEAARDGKIDPVIGRDEEIRRCIQVLSRRTKNNPVVIGEPRRRQDRDRRRPRHAHRQRRRAGKPGRQALDGARHGRADRRCKVPR